MELSGVSLHRYERTMRTLVGVVVSWYQENFTDRSFSC